MFRCTVFGFCLLVIFDIAYSKDDFHSEFSAKYEPLTSTYLIARENSTGRPDDTKLDPLIRLDSDVMKSDSLREFYTTKWSRDKESWETETIQNIIKRATQIINDDYLLKWASDKDLPPSTAERLINILYKTLVKHELTRLMTQYFGRVKIDYTNNLIERFVGTYAKAIKIIEERKRTENEN